MKYSELLKFCLLSFLLCAVAGSCLRDKRVSCDGEIIVGTLRGPSSVAMIKLMDSLGRDSSSQIRVRLFSEPMQIRKEMIEGSLDFAVLPTTMAALSYNKGMDYRVAAIPLWGSLFLCGSDTTVRALSDLKGEKVYLMAKGMTPDILFRHLLVRSGLEPGIDVELDYRFPTHIDLANAAISGRAGMCVLTEPYLSQALNSNPRLHVLMDLDLIWQSVENCREAQTAFLCKGKLADSRRDMVEKLVNAYRTSSEWVKAHPDSAAFLCAANNINPDTISLMQSIPRTNINVVEAAMAEQDIMEYLKVFFGMSPESIGSRMPDEKFIVK